MPLTLVAVLPGLVATESVLAGRYALLVHTDERYQAVAQHDPGVAEFLKRFATAFGQKLAPPMVCYERGTTPAPSTRLTEFRDCVAIAGLVRARQQTLRAGRVTGYVYSESYEFYPVAPGAGGGMLSLRTSTERGDAQRARPFRPATPGGAVPRASTP